jgi:hypothetical protein
MKYPANSIYKYELKQLIERVVNEKEVSIGSLMPCADLDDGDLYD